jgi:hypothetical protein
MGKHLIASKSANQNLQKHQHGGRQFLTYFKSIYSQEDFFMCFS